MITLIEIAEFMRKNDIKTINYIKKDSELIVHTQYKGVQNGK